MANRSRIASLAVALGLALAGPAFAQQPVDDEAVQSAKTLMLTGRSAEARLLLEEAAARHPGNNDIEFLLGLLAIEDKNYDQAIRRFRSILVRVPGAVRVRLELGRAFYLKHDYENAFRQFQFARAGNPPLGVIASIDRFLGAIRLEKNWSYSVSMAIAPDTNINNGSSTGEVILFGLPFELSEETRQRSGIGLALDASAELAPRIGDRTRLRMGAAIQRREYSGKAFDDMTISVHAGPRFVLDKWDISVLGIGFQRRFGGRRVNEAVGARSEATHYLDSRTSLSITMAALQVRYPHFPPQTGPLFSVSAGAMRALTPESSLLARIGVGRKSARSPEFAFWSRSISVGYYRDLPGGFSVYVEPTYTQSCYDSPDPFFAMRRKDQLLELRFSVLNRRIMLRGFTPRIGLTWARRNSTIDLFDYTQRRLEVGVTSVF